MPEMMKLGSPMKDDDVWHRTRGEETAARCLYIWREERFIDAWQRPRNVAVQPSRGARVSQTAAVSRWLADGPAKDSTRLDILEDIRDDAASVLRSLRWMGRDDRLDEAPP